MHELSIAQSIFDIVGESLTANGGGKLRKVKLKVGELANVVPESLEFCFDAITRGSLLENAKLEIERTDIVARCAGCGGEFMVNGYLFKCPACGNVNIEIISGNELQVVEIEIEELERL